MAIFIQSFTLTGGESPSGTSITTTSQQISASQTTGVVSASGPWDVWALTAGQQISRNGTVDPNTALVTKLYYNNHTLYQFNGSNWWYFDTIRSTSTTFFWITAADPTIAVVPNVWDPNHKGANIVLSSDGLTGTMSGLTASNDQSFFAKETTVAGPKCALLYWEVVLNSANTNGQVGIGINTAGVGAGSYLGHDTTSVGWLGSNGAVTYNNASSTTWATYAKGSRLCFALDLINGKLWGRVAGGNWNNDVIANQNPATNTGGYVIPTSTIYVAGALGTYIVPAVSLFANTDTAVASFEPASWLFTPPVGFLPWSGALPVAAPVAGAAPTQAANAGFNTKVFEDDFTSTSTIFSTITSTTQTGVNWYCGNSGGVSQPQPGAWDMFTTTTAAQLSNGNSGGGSFASANGGLWEIKGVSQITVNTNWQSVSNSQTGPNAWKHGYFEAYIQFNINNSSPAGFPAWWSWPVNNSPGAEVDCMESGSSNNPPSGGLDNSGWTIHQPPGGAVPSGGSGVMQHPVDSNWHAYGWLWTSTGTGTGKIDFYFDNVRVGGVTTGTGGTVTDMENATGQFLALGTGVGIPIYVDWVRVWR